MPVPTKKRVFGLDLMRAIAILSVVCSHFLWIFPDLNNGFTQLMRLSGFMGVEIFFVLSGFLIGGILYRLMVVEKQGGGRLGYFLIRRWFRTLPNYYLVLLINIGLWIFLGRQLPENWSNYFFFLQNALSGMPIFFTESWSLPVEEFAYVIGPLLLYLIILISGKKHRKAVFLGVTLTVILFFTATKVWYNQVQAPNSLEYWNIELKAVVLYRIDAIYYGVLFTFISQQFSQSWARLKNELLLSGLLLFVGFQACVNLLGLNTFDHPFLFNVLYLPICSLSVALTLPWCSQLQRAPRPWMEGISWISLISYSMYLLHYSIVLQLMRVYITPSEPGYLEGLFLGLLYLLLTIGLSYLLYTFFEKPMMDLRDRPGIRRMFGMKN